MDLHLSGMKALITGGASGIGLALADRFAAEGCDVGVCARTRSALKAAGDALAEHGNTVHAEVVDLADAGAIAPWVESAVSRLGGLDIVVHNASGAAGVGEEAWRRNVDVDVLGFARLVEHATPHLARSSAAAVIAISSTAALESFGAPAAPFGAMKAALIHHAAGLSRSLAPRGIRVNSVSPGPILVEDGAWARVRRERPEYFAGIVEAIPRGRMGSAEELAGVVAFLASPVSSLINGANIVADGGMTKRIPF